MIFGKWFYMFNKCEYEKEEKHDKHLWRKNGNNWSWSLEIWMIWLKKFLAWDLNNLNGNACNIKWLIVNEQQISIVDTCN